MSVELKTSIENFIEYVNENIFKVFNTNELTEKIIGDILTPALESVRTESDIPAFLNLVNKYNPTLLRDLPYSASMPIEIAMYSFSGYAGMVKASAKIGLLNMCALTARLNDDNSIAELLVRDIIENLGVTEWEKCWESCSISRERSCVELISCITYTPTLPGCEYKASCTASTFSSLATALPRALTPEGGNEFQIIAAGVLCE